MEIKDMKELKWPARMRSPPESRDMNTYCEFHRDHGHTTENCKALQRETEALIKRRLLSSYVGNNKRPRNDRGRERAPEAKRDGQPTVGTINIIIGAIVANFEVKRILVDNGSAANILLQEAFAKMGISSQQLKAVKTPLQGFGGGVITPEGVVELPQTLVSGQKQVTEITSFQVIRAIVSTFHLAMKFPTSNGVGVVCGDQAATRQCYVASVREINNDVIQISRTKLEIAQQHDKKVTIGRDLNVTLKTELIGCLSRNIDVFAWKVEDIPGIDPKIAVHRLNISPGARPVQYPDWLANVVLVKKANGKWRVYTNFTDLNKACPKDSYSLLRIDNLVDSTSGHKLYNFLDAFSGYHQILMAEEDQEKTSFMVDSTIYYYEVMFFDLKNARATYQRLINKVFANLIGRNVEAYVDDMVVKSKRVDQHISDLEEFFHTLRKYRMKLNPAKCAFGVASGKFLGFMITHQGIEANPDKIQALASMESPRNKKEEFKQTLASPPILTRPEPGDTLFLYLAISQNAVSGLLVKEFNRVQQPIYYVSKVLQDWETRYTLAEQLALALVITARKLRQYFQSHPIVVLTNQPVRHILQKPDISGRLMKWVIELGEFDIEFKPRPSIKAQALADFIAELTPRPRGPDSRFEFEATNNEAEYGVVVIALELALSLELEFVKDLQRKFKSCEIAKIARKHNRKADALSRLVFMGVDSLDRTVHIKVITEPSINQTPDVMDIDNELSWMDPIIEFITSGNLPSDARLARSIRARAPRYCMISGILFRRSIILPYLRCLRPSESSQALAEVHEGVCGNHQGARALAFKLIRYGYYWPTMKNDASEYVKRCDRCQRFAVEYFTKWAEAEPLAMISEPKLRAFTWRSIICRFGIPKVLITNNGRDSWSDELPSILWTYRTTHRTTSGETPFMLAYGIEAMVPVEIRLPSHKRLEPETSGHTTEHLALLEEVWEQAAIKVASYRTKTAKYFNNKVKTRRFRAGDLVLRRAKAAGHPSGKLGPIWEGPFEVIRQVRKGAYSLRDTSGRPLPRP
ncbi:uncharacterized protein LOC111411417 [Olea europaea var. sylvestris]|uniref:uncharacterized protein LOC111411417 n=1 Tax=Olea europaea var. sylvestris TaxID=158386 RepID=UPI000C1D737C|nr:uncharacterized protein LOC111411417 [Olea europaea var. sylvestris]